MYGDPDVMRRRVDQLREQAVDIRTLADQLVARTEGIGWSGRAADAMRVRVTDRASHLRSAAAQHETAADSLDKHLQAVRTLREQIADVERRTTDLVAEARTRTSAGREPDPDDVVLGAFTPPPSGHRDWLGVELPGLARGDTPA